MLLLAACGRIGFDARVDPAIDALDASPDALELACSIKPTTPTTLDVSGTTFEYTSFNNTSQPVFGVAIALRTGAIDLGQTVSDQAGAYALTYQTGGVSRPLVIEYSRGGYFTTTVFTDSLVDKNLTGLNNSLWQLGDGPVWSLGSMQSIYAAGGETLDAQTGTLNIAVRDCGNNGIADIQGFVDPPPGKLLYQDTDGSPSQTRTATTGPYNHALAYRAQPGTTTITAVGGGRTFVKTTVQVTAGDQNTLAIVRATN